jgi:hypothetical protein
VARLGLSSRRLLICAVLAVVVHLPLMPFARYFTLGIFDFLFDETEEEDGEAVVPIELELGESSDEVAERIKKAAEDVVIDTPDPSADTIALDAGVDASKGLEDGGPDGGLVETDAGPEVRPDGGLEPKPSFDPKDLSKNPNNVQIVLVGTKLRSHPVGAKLGSLLPSLKQWEPFFKDSGLDPVADIDVMVITGPQFRVSGEVVAIMKFNVEMSRIKTIIDKMVTREDGEWLKDAPTEAARAKLDGAMRVFALVPDKHLLYVLPWPKKTKKEKSIPDDEFQKIARERVDAQLRRVKRSKLPDYTKESFAIDGFMIQPYKLVSKDGTAKLGPLEVQVIPTTLESMRFQVFPKGNDADVAISFKAKNAEQADKDLQDLEGSWSMVQLGAKAQIDLALPDLAFEKRGTMIEAHGTLPESGLEKVFELGKKKSEELKQKKK